MHAILYFDDRDINPARLLARLVAVINAL